MSNYFVERERKYLLDSDSANEILAKCKKKFGIIQWYLDENQRIRLEIFKEKTGFRHCWTKTRKYKISNGINKEISDTIDPINLQKEELISLMKKPFVLKIRHQIDERMTIDEYLTNKHVQNIPPNKFLCEIELLENDEEDVYRYYEEEYNLSNCKCELRNYEIAKESVNRNIQDYIEYIENYLLGNITLVVTTGRSFFQNFTDEENKAIINLLKNEGLDSEKLKQGLISNGMYKFFDNITKKIEYEEFKKVFEKSCAEIDSIKLIIERGYRISKVIYFVFPDQSDTKKTPAIYEILEKLTKKIFSVEKISSELIDYVENPESSNAASLAETFKNIWSKLETIEKNTKSENSELLIDLTGGYKIIGIMLAIYCLFKRRKFFYVYQKSNNLIEFPALPMGWDYSEIDESLSALKSLSNYNIIDYSQYSSLPQIFKYLFKISRTSDYISIFPIDRIMQNYEQARKIPFGYGQNFLKFVGDEGDIEFEYLRKMIAEKWSLQWIGDQIPETVEHSQRHSKRLMEFATNLINTIGEDEFLNDVPIELRKEFYFVLTIAMNVHDLGHTKLYYTMNNKKIKLEGLPSMVRDLHNELTYQMLEEESVYNILKRPEKYNQEKWEKVVKAVKLVCRYHRGHMPIKVEDLKSVNKEFIKVFNLKIEPLETVVKKFFPNDENWQRLTIMATKWLKFIDATDIQADRVITESYKKERLERLIYEITELIESFRRRKNCDPQICDKLEKLSDFIEKIKKNPSFQLFKEAEECGKSLEKNFVYPELKKIIDSSDDKIIIPPDWLKNIDRIAFKAIQFTHFEKHSVVNYVTSRFFKKESIFGNKNRVLYLRMNVNENVSVEILNGIRKDIENEFMGSRLYENSIKKVEVEFVPMRKVLVTPLGKSPGVLYTLIKKIKPDKVIIITSKDVEPTIPEILEKASFKIGEVNIISFDDPFTGFSEMDEKEKEFNKINFKATDDIILNLAGGTSFLQYIATKFSEKLQKEYNIKKVFAVDRRDIEDQRKDPYKVGEVVELP